MNSPIELTSQTIRDAEFREGWRGYSQIDVDQFLEQVAAGIDALHARIRELGERPQARPVVAEVQDDTVKRTLSLAQRAADLVVAEAKAVAERTMSDANRRSEQLLAETESSARLKLSQTEQQCAQLLAQARESAEKERSTVLQGLVAERTALDQEQVQKANELVELRRLAAATHDRLRAVLADHTARLDRLSAIAGDESAVG